MSYLRENIKDSPHDEQSDGSVGCLEDIFGVIVSFVVLVGLLDLGQELVPVLQTELLPAQLLPAVELRQRLVHDGGVLDVQHLVIDIRSREDRL